MRLVSFDALRSLSLGGIKYIKPENMLKQLADIRQADGCLFPEYWQVNPLTFALGCRIFPSAASYYIGHNKIEMTRCFQILAPENTPCTLIEPNTPNAAERIWEQMTLPFVAKIPKSARGEGVFLIRDRSDWNRYLQLSPSLYAQEYLPIDRDLRIVWVGDEILCGYWRIQPEGGFHNNVSQGGRIEHGIIPDEASQLVTKLARELGINYGGFDIAMVGRQAYILEFNRHFGTKGLPNRAKSHDQAILAYPLKEWDGHEDEPDEPVTPFPQAI